MKVNSLEASSAGKNKTKDIHLPSIDVTFGSNRILCVSIHRNETQNLLLSLGLERVLLSRTVEDMD